MFRTLAKHGLLPLLTVLVVLGLSAQPAQALFEQTPHSASYRGMGETGVAVFDPAYAAFQNPAQLAEVVRGAAAISYVQPFGYDFNQFVTIGGALPIDAKYGNLGFGLTNYTVDYQDVDLLKETRFTVAHGVTLFEDMHSTIRFGYGLNLYRAELGETVTGDDPGSDTALGVDLGMMMTLRQRTHLGFRVENLNNPDIGVDNEELGRRLIAGIAYEPYTGVVTTFEFDNELGRELQYHGGLAMTVVEGFLLRAGIVTNPSKLTGGFGYTIQDFSLNYGFSTGGGTLESTHQFGLRFAWGGEAQ